MIIRTYECPNCNQQFEVTCESSDGDPDCPFCSRVLEWRPGMFAITGNKSRAIDITQNILETEFGMTNINDRQREGDVAAIAAPPPGGAERDAQIRQLSEAAQAYGQPALTPNQAEMAKAFWAGGQTPMQSIPAADMLNNAKLATAAANAEGVNPMALLHKAGKEGKLKTRIDVIARG